MQKSHLKILLIEPPYYRLFKKTYSLNRFPLSLGYLAGTIRERTNWNVMAYNADFADRSEVFKISYLTGPGFNNYLNNLNDLSNPIWGEIKSTISAYNPTVVGITTKSQNFLSACIVAKLAKEVNSEIIVVVGGPHPSLVGAQTLSCPDIDLIVKGEGEKTVVDLLNAIETKDKFSGIAGISYRENGIIIENKERELIEDLNSLCFPHENAPVVLKDYSRYAKGAFGYIFSTRGCPYNCFFCGSYKIWGRNVRFRSPDNVMQEIKSLWDKGINQVHFDDDTFGINKNNIDRLCNSIIRYCPGLEWSCEMHVKLIDDGIISLMKNSGCIAIQIGIESGNNEMLRKIRKNFTIEEALSACKIIKKYNIELQAFFMVGFPQETEDTLNDTLLAMEKTCADLLIYSIFTPYPNTEAFEFCKEKGLIGDEYNPSLYNHHSPVNHFCVNINTKRFRILAQKIEKIVDRKNQGYLRRKYCSHAFRKILKTGLINSFKIVLRNMFYNSNT